jgi:SAM-dependent methyltransferase
VSKRVVRFSDRLRVWATAMAQVRRLPWAVRLRNLLVPVDVVRYEEFHFLLRFLKCQGLSGRRILDVSSPHMMAHMLASANDVIKADINPRERRAVAGRDRLRFQLADAKRLPFRDSSFDVVYSISVIEHIHEGYRDAVREMLRVTRPGGVLYLTFPVSVRHVEEWVDSDPYSKQAVRGGRVFFQYRFDRHDVDEILEELRKGAEIVEHHLLWERRGGDYDVLIGRLKQLQKYGIFGAPGIALLSLISGFSLMAGEARGFEAGKPFGNLHVLARRVGRCRCRAGRPTLRGNLRR